MIFSTNETLDFVKSYFESKKLFPRTNFIFKIICGAEECETELFRGRFDNFRLFYNNN